MKCPLFAFLTWAPTDIAAYLYSLCIEKTVQDRVEELVVTVTAQEETSKGQGLRMTLKSVRVVAERVRALSLCMK